MKDWKCLFCGEAHTEDKYKCYDVIDTPLAYEHYSERYWPFRTQEESFDSLIEHIDSLIETLEEQSG